VTKQAENGGNGGDWKEYKLLILGQIEDLKSEIVNFQNIQQDVMKQIVEIQTQLSALKVQSGVWGLIAGSIPVSLAMAIKWMSASN